MSIFLMPWRKGIAERGVNDKIALRIVGKDIDTEADFIEREKLLSVVLVVLKQLMKYGRKRDISFVA
ncbi:hypothetical protein DY000_02044441 [Brassica cretica]|uniref:Uncharacterized protein n=1 Tax=Brassica cretica TaxID=69181 RepID=A0ABQ7F4E6_BRACR|nr:hypothetical protein DY000_02044441 [Brassica cretica]